MILLLLLLVSSVISAISIGLLIHPSELQLVSHYSAFGIIHLYRDQWFYLLVFVLFVLVVAVLHIIMSIKIMLIKGHSIGVMFAWLGIGIMVMGWAVVASILNIWTPL